MTKLKWRFNHLTFCYAAVVFFLKVLVTDTFIRSVCVYTMVRADTKHQAFIEIYKRRAQNPSSQCKTRNIMSTKQKP